MKARSPKHNPTASQSGGGNHDEPLSRRLWTFLNSPFALFLLSSVAIGLLSFAYSTWTHHITREKSIEKVRLEILLRIQAVDQMAGGADGNYYSALADIAKVLDGSPNVTYYVRRPIFTEYERQNIGTLLWQLYLLVPSSDQPRVRALVAQTARIADELREVRRRAIDGLPAPEDDPKWAKMTKVEKQRAEDQADVLNKEYGQHALYEKIHILAKSIWWDVAKLN